MDILRGIDVSFSSLPPGWLEARPGVAVVVQNLWTGGRVPAVAASNLQAVIAAGRIPAGYMVASPWYGPQVALQAARQRLGELWDAIRVVAVDVETLRATPLAPVEWPSKERTWEYIEALRGEGKVVCLYTARWFWQGYYGNDRDPRWVEVPLWYMDITRRPVDALLPPDFGPWGADQVVGRQYRLDVSEGGVTLDEDVFDASFWGGEEMDKRLDEQVTYYVIGPNLERVQKTATLLEFLRDLALGFAWTLKDEAQDAVIEQIRQSHPGAPHRHKLTIEGETSDPL